MRWDDVHADQQSAWLSDPVTAAYIERLKIERESSHGAALMSMRVPALPETISTAARRVGEMDAYNKAIEIATRTAE